MSRLPDPDFWRGKRVLLTGHTGFKGSWAGLWLTKMGAEVTGYALPPASDPSLHALLHANGLPNGQFGDIRDGEALATVTRKCDPEIILHMAAQPLVRESYATPAETFDVNVMGTVRLLEAAPRDEFRRYTGLEERSIRPQIEAAIAQGYLTEDEHDWQITEHGKLFLNSLLELFLSE